MKVLSWLARIVGALVALVVMVVVTLIILGHGLATRHVPRAASALAVTPDSSMIPRGEHLSAIVCAGCHAPELTARPLLSGGHENFMDIPNGPKLGVLWAPNITPGGRIKGQSDARIARAIREGISFDDRPMIVMPSSDFHGLSDRDVASLIAFLHSQPSVDHVVPARAPNLLAYIVLGTHMFETSLMNPIPNPIADVAEDSTVAYGAYLTPVLSCRTCHGPDYHGGVKGQLPPIGPSLTKLVNEQPFATFERALRQGVKPAGGSLDPSRMPWPVFANLSDLEVRAIYEFLKSQPK